MSALDTSVRPQPQADDERLPAVEDLMAATITFNRMIHVMKAQHASRSAQTLLFPLASQGPLRLSALAEAMHADPSTVSRQVAELVRADFVRRDADPGDGRASLLVMTPAGREEHERLRHQRNVQISEALADWSEHEITCFTAHLRRFSAGMAALLGQPAPSTATDTGAAGPSTSATAQEPR